MPTNDRRPLTLEEKEDARRLREIWLLYKARHLGAKQVHIAEKCGWTSGGAFSQYINGKIPLNFKTLYQLAKALEVDPAQISPSKASEASAKAKAIPEGDHFKVPVYTNEAILAGLFNAPISTIETDAKISEEAFGMHIADESNAPDYKEGDLVIIDCKVSPKPGDFVVVRFAGSVLFRRYRERRTADGQTIFDLVPVNQDYPTDTATPDTMQLVGTLIEHRRYRKGTPTLTAEAASDDRAFTGKHFISSDHAASRTNNTRITHNFP